MLTLSSSSPKYIPRDYQPWRDIKFARSRLRLWGEPNSKPSTWAKGQRDRLTRVSKLIGKGSLLDVGCGCGHLYPLVRNIISDYTGIDFKAMIDICKTYFPEVDWREGNVYDLSSLGMYDNVVAIQLFIHLPNLLRPLRQCWNHTEKILLFTVRTGSDDPSITVNKATGTIGRRYSCEELAAAINCLEDIGCIEVFLGNFSGRVMYVRLNKIEGKKCRAFPQMFDSSNLQLI